MLTRIFGLHGTGKTEALLARLEDCIRQKKQAFLIVPEQSAVSVERLLIDRLGNPANMYIEVINFKRLCNRVFRESGGLVGAVPDKAACALAMSHVLSQSADLLSEYAPLADDTDFAAKMLATVTEMHRSRIRPDDLETLCKTLAGNGSAALSDKLHDVALAYRAYDAYLAGTLDFPGDLLDKLYETLCGFRFFEGKHVFLDAFYGFTAQELAIIGKILPSAEETCITFLCENEKTANKCFLRAKNAALACRRLAAESGVPVKDIFLTENRKHAPHSALAHIAAHFSLDALAVPRPEAPLSGVTLTACEDIYAEAAFAVQTVSDLLTSGVLPREIVLCARNQADYDGILDTAFESAGIPYAFDKAVDLSTTPTAALVFSAFDIYFSWSLEAVSAYIKSGLSGLSDEVADKLDLYLHTWNIHGKAYFHEEWHMNPAGMRADAADTALLALVSDAHDALLSCLDTFSASLDAAKTASDMAHAVYELTVNIARLSGKDRFDDRADGEYLDLLCRALDTVALTLAEQTVTPHRFYELLRAVIKNMSIGKIPELLDQVRFSPVTLMRTDGIRYVILLGVNDGIFPAKPASSDVFRDTERKMLRSLGVELAETADDKAFDELFLAYTALCSAKDGAFVLYRTGSLEKKELYPSVLVALLEKMLGITADVYPKADTAAALASAVSDESLFEQLLTLPDGVEKATVRAYFADKPAYMTRLAAIEKSDDARRPLSDDLLTELYGDTMTGSYSKLERFRRCPFSYFCTYTLRLAATPEGRVGNAERGNIIHAVLEELVPEIAARHKAGHPFDETALKAAIHAKLEELLERMMPNAGSALSGRFAYLFAKTERVLVPLCKLLCEELTVSRFEPVDFELSIGPDGAIKPVELPLTGGKTLKIVGKIDRVDLYRDAHSGKTYLRIVDYKTGSTKFDLSDIHRGFNLQMLLYLYTLLQNGETRYGKVYPAGVLYSHVADPKIPVGDKVLSDSGDDESLDYKADVSGLLVADADILFAMDSTGSGTYIPVKLKTGVLAENAAGTLPEDEFFALLGEASAFAADMACGILRGDKRALPEGAKAHNPCDYCDYKEICPKAV